VVTRKSTVSRDVLPCNLVEVHIWTFGGMGECVLPTRQ
jgi:hypothetical protein